MESMVSDTEIRKVIIISDKKYAEKSNSRTAGVGTEAQIISPEIYANTAQSKFVVVVAEKDERGNAYLPLYYKSRIYIDLSNADGYAQNFEKLVRWIYDKPVDIRPEFGERSLDSWRTEGIRSLERQHSTTEPWTPSAMPNPTPRGRSTSISTPSLRTWNASEWPSPRANRTRL